LWDNGWYAGHHMLAYSVLYPPLGALLGPRLLGALATLAAVAAFSMLVSRAYGERAWLASAWFAVAAAANLFAGRVPFTLGVALGLFALVALQRERTVLALLLALLTGLASPVAGLFLALAGLALALARARFRRKRDEGPRARGRKVTGVKKGIGAAAAVLLALAAAVPPGVLSALFPEGGHMPFDLTSYLPCVAVSVLLVVALPREAKALRIGAALYGLLATAAFVFSTPFGGNAARMGMLFAGPVLAAAVLERPDRPRWRVVAVAVVALPLVFWALAPVVKTLRVGEDPAIAASYYRPLLRFLDRRHQPMRVEIPPTRFHWEATYVPERFPITRGWERQLDHRYANLFYSGTLTPVRYLRWLRNTATSYVAEPLRAAPDYAAVAERRLLAAGVPGLHPVFHDADWRVWRVVGSGLGRITGIGREAFSVHGTVPAARVRWTRWWSPQPGGFVHRAPGGWTSVRTGPGGRVGVDAG
ncbi:MAG TPA: hypothetical protein VHR88_05360, partial [Solirubrobacteraceae bacterium]|nr:hypothetical protein [Solirubrobacteraceae bacterium]